MKTFSELSHVDHEPALYSRFAGHHWQSVSRTPFINGYGETVDRFSFRMFSGNVFSLSVDYPLKKNSRVLRPYLKSVTSLSDEAYETLFCQALGTNYTNGFEVKKGSFYVRLSDREAVLFLNADGTIVGKETLPGLPLAIYASNLVDYCDRPDVAIDIRGWLLDGRAADFSEMEPRYRAALDEATASGKNKQT